MPSKHVVRHFKEGGVYHVFNQGVERREIFIDDEDKRIFLYYLNVYLTPLKQVLSKHPHLPLRLQAKNLSEEVEMLAYCLMPNHFHLLIKQKSINGVSKFLKQITNAYTLYFNNKYQRIGGLFQGRFKAVSIETNEQMLQLSRYIHLNPDNPETYPWSSYGEYIENKGEAICSKETVLFFFPGGKYESFCLDREEYAKELGRIKHLTLED
jgi:putative transposase